MVHLVKARYRLYTMGMTTMRDSVITAGAGKTRAWRRSMNRLSALGAAFMMMPSILTVPGRVCPQSGREQIPAV
jgi:hypothetical protein